MLQRKIRKTIEEFYAADNNRALLITGARQVGKSYIIDRFGEEHFQSYIKLDFIENPNYIALFEGVRSADDILLRLSTEFGDKMQPGNTLIFFDEVQECPEIITQIKYLVQDGSYRYILSGSLLGTIMKNVRSIPVGYMSVIRMFPLDFEEFAIANGVGEGVLDNLRERFNDRKPVDDYIHRRMIELFELYLIVGGMPAVVREYLETKNLSGVAKTQSDILELYREDIAKYDLENKLYLREIFDLIPSEINSKSKRFILKNLNEYTKFSKYADSFIWLKNAGVALPVYTANEPVVPLILSKATNLFKLFLNDVGLLASMYGNGIQLEILRHHTTINFGAIYENVAAQELSAHGFDLFFYNNKKKGEVDFVVEQGNKVIPVEIKSGKDYYRHAAMNNLLSEGNYPIDEGYVFCNGNTDTDGCIVYYPIYMLMFLEKEALPDEVIFDADFSDLR